MDAITNFFKAFDQWYRAQLPGDVMLIRRSCQHLEPYKLDLERSLRDQICAEMAYLCRNCEEAK